MRLVFEGAIHCWFEIDAWPIYLPGEKVEVSGEKYMIEEIAHRISSDAGPKIVDRGKGEQVMIVTVSKEGGRRL